MRTQVGNDVPVDVCSGHRVMEDEQGVAVTCDGTLLTFGIDPDHGIQRYPSAVHDLPAGGLQFVVSVVDPRARRVIAPATR